VTWYRSLYWRIAMGVVAFLAAMLVVQAMLFVWAVSQTGRTLPGQSPARLGMAVAVDIAQTLERDPQIDLQRYVKDQYAQYNHPFFVMMTDGRYVTSGSKSFPEPLLQVARDRLQRRLDRPMGPLGPRDPNAAPGVPGIGGGMGPRPDRPRMRGGPPPDWWQQPDRFLERIERGPGGGQFARPSPIIVSGQLAGVVVVPPQAPFGYLLGRFAPMLGLVAIAVLGVGTVLTSLMIFGPARRRLRELETAARQLGAGDLSARAPDRGGDEIAAVASAFNAMADDLSARAAALAESDRVRRQLLADVSHELTTPITAMRGYLETLAMPELTLDDATRQRYLAIVGDETGRLEQVIGDLLDLARLEGGGGELHIGDVAVAQLFDRVSARHGRALEDAGVTLQTAIEPGADTVNADRDRLEQALQNLAANAIRYAPRGSTVRLTAAPASGVGSQASGLGPQASVVLSVEDEGPGIPAEHLPHVFDRFYKADASRAGVSGGSGLGLSIVKAIVERHGATITVRSRPGRTVFEIRGLPV
jgi:signal transduction histidine kinase